ncbi:magnesium and cobalt transport protein CorA [Streptomyces kaniharaensis]|uniref:Magnesium and cobalt transport protein CorA n=1 Tax=Streptomyces kaniharaensis TaxID=212423 RepID=A0A6N7KJ51_9ACTN|nr:magnesium and cobalt transport protein CorA [Streptomyces kaniharaensis]MQS11542.1 magnesium and cobalt transport protein CorA [Streptomyces kaniharaensis]
MSDMIVHCAIYRDGRRVETLSHPAGALAAARSAGPGGFVWIGLFEPTAEELDQVGSEFALHPLAAEDAVRAHQRPKIEAYQGSLFVALKTLGYHPGAHAVTSGEVMVFVGTDFVLTVRHGEDTPLSGLRARLEQQPELLAYGPSAVLHSVCATVVDGYMEVAAALQTDLDDLEADLFAPSRVGPDIAGRIYGSKRQVMTVRRATVPLLEPMLRLERDGAPFVRPEALPYLRNVADHLARVNDQVDGMDRLLSDILSANLAQVSVQQNNDMRKISAWAALAAVPTMIAGIYGMNFDHMPELHQPWGYPAALGLMAAVCVVLHRIFKRHDWL